MIARTHIILLSRNFPPAICGVGDYTRRLAEALANRGYSISIITGTPGSELSKGHVFHAQRWPEDLPAQLLRARQQYGPATILWQYTPASFSLRQTPFWWPAMMRRLNRMGIRQSIIFHEVALRPQGNILQRLRSQAQQWIARSAHAQAAAASTSVALYRQYFRNPQPMLIPVGANMLPMASQANAGRQSSTLFCFTNRCSPAILEALSGLQGDGRHWKLYLAGRTHPGQEQQLSRLATRLGIRNSIHLLGELPGPELQERLAQAGIFLQHQPLSTDGQGGVSLKNGVTAAAMAFGLPIITTAGDMTDRQFFRHGVNCWLLEQDDACHWEAALHTLLADNALRQALGDEARQSFLSHLQWETIAAEVDQQLLQPTNH